VVWETLDGFAVDLRISSSYPSLEAASVVILNHAGNSRVDIRLRDGAEYYVVLVESNVPDRLLWDAQESRFCRLKETADIWTAVINGVMAEYGVEEEIRTSVQSSGTERLESSWEVTLGYKRGVAKRGTVTLDGDERFSFSTFGLEFHQRMDRGLFAFVVPEEAVEDCAALAGILPFLVVED